MPRFNGTSEFFTSAKTSGPILIDSAVARDALIRATIDPIVRSIEKLADPAPSGALAVLVRDDGRFAYGLGDDGHPVPDAAHAWPIRPMIITLADLYREPANSNDRLIWACRDRRVSSGLRYQIVQALTDGGPSRIDDLVSTVGMARRSEHAVFSLACADVIEIDELASCAVHTGSIVRIRTCAAVATASRLWYGPPPGGG
ncbi:hypothetical protein [Bradyrhizobium sp. LB11.1]|uniref:hypothetical protein n=1 Tax=Bradyrhizobium sp. LB11.1 TaxID=3156326 RepID=UPI00339B62C4